jgi:hypothetical protein
MRPEQRHLPAMVSRREALSAGGLALAGAASLASAAAPAHGIVFGANRDTYPRFHAAVPLAKGLRMYYDTENLFPAAWPERFGARMTLSLRPNPSDLLSGRLDRQLKAIIDSAPPHSDLTFWHENTTGNPLGYPAHVNNARASVAMQRHGHSLCRGTRVKFGVITVGPAAQQLGWLAPGLDWYGDDLYEFPELRNPDGTFSHAKIIARLNSNLQAWREASGKRSPAIRICESNSPIDSHRSRFFTTIAQWLARHNGDRMLTYWNPNGSAARGGDSGAWPPSAAVVRRLRSLSKEYDGAAG